MPKKKEEEEIKTRKRRSKNEGMIRWDDSKHLWEARYVVGVKPDGASKYKSLYAKINQKGALLKKMQNALAELGKGEYVDPSSKSLYIWCKEWYELYKEPTLKTNTKDKYENSLKRLEKYDISKVRLKDINHELLQKMYNKMGNEYKEETIKATHSLINGALKKAVSTNQLNKNPAEELIIPKNDYDDEGEVKALTLEEYECFIEQMRKSNYYMFALFMSNTGLRPGETIALDRKDINLTKKEIKVYKTFIPSTGKVQNSTKTKSSKRTVPIPDGLITPLKEYMLKQKNKKDNDPLFQTTAHTRMRPRNALRQFKVVGERLGCEWVNLHSMRHTYASRLFAQDIDVKVISQLLGHKDISTTYNTYVHFINNVVANSVQVLNNDSKLPDLYKEIPKANSEKKKQKIYKLKTS